MGVVMDVVIRPDHGDAGWVVRRRKRRVGGAEEAIGAMVRVRKSVFGLEDCLVAVGGVDDGGVEGEVCWQFTGQRC